MNRRFNFGRDKKNGEKHLSLAPLVRFDIGGLIDEFLREPFAGLGGFGLLKAFKAPAIDVYEEGNKVVVKADLPGIDKKNIKLHLDRDILTISGETKKEKEEKKEGYYYSERSFGKIQRSIRLSEGTKPEDIKASYKDGVLVIELPKAKEAGQRGRDIKVE